MAVSYKQNWQTQTSGQEDQAFSYDFAYTQRGNLAYQAQPLYLPDYEEAYEREEREAELLQEQRAKYLRLKKRSQANRRRKLLMAGLVVGLVTFIFAGLMVRQAKIYEQNFANTAVRRQISEQQEINGDLQNRLVSKSDSGYIEKEALRLFGLRRPSQLQRVVVDLPPSDNLVFYEQKEDHSDKKGQTISNNYQVLEAYMKALGLSHQE